MFHVSCLSFGCYMSIFIGHDLRRSSGCFDKTVQIKMHVTDNSLSFSGTPARQSEADKRDESRSTSYVKHSLLKLDECFKR